MDCCSIQSCSLLNWTDVKFSGLLLASFNIAFVLSWLAEMNLYTIAAYLLLFYIVSGIAIAKLPSGDHYEHVSRDQVENLIRGFYKWLLGVDQYFRRVVSLEDTYLTAKFFAGVFTLNTLSSWFSECCLIWLGVNILFAYTPVYNTNKDLIDGSIETLKKSALEYYEIVRSMIPKYVEKTK